MSVPASHRPTRELAWLVVALVGVGAIVLPLWQFTGSAESRAEFLAKWTPDRLGRLFIGPEQIACYVCFAWAGLILLSRAREVQRQRAAFHYELLPTEEGARVLPEDARPLARKVDHATAGRPWGLYVHGNSDVDGAIRDVERIVTGLRWKAVAEPLRVTGPVDRTVTDAAWDLGATLAATLAG